MPNKSLQATRDGAFSSASRFTSFGPACLSSGCWTSMISLTNASVCLLAAALCGCSGLPARRTISLRLSSPSVNQTNGSLSPQQEQELHEFLELTDATLLRH